MTETAPTDQIFARTARGTGWLIVWRMATRLLGVASTVVLVRLLAPEDFGLIALATSFTLAVEAMALIDVEDAVTRERAPGREVYDTAFTLGLLRGLAIGGMIAVLAFPAARFFAEPRLAPVILALGLGFLLDGLINVGVVDFRRDFAFHREVQLWLAPRLLSILLALGTAVLLHSYWALVIGILSQRALRVVLSYRMHPFRPRLGLSAWRGLLGYSLWLSLINVTSLLRDRADSILLGRLLGTAPVGIFAIGAEIAALPTTELVEPACRAAFSGFSTARNTGLDAGETWLAIIASMAPLTFPAGVGLALIAGPLVQLAFGARWMAAVPLVQLLGIAGSLAVFGTIGSVLLRVHGKMRLVIGIILAGATLRVALLLLLIPRFGLLGAGFAVALGLVFDHLVYLVVTLRGFAIALPALLGRLWRSVLATAVMAAALLVSGLGGQVPAPAASAAMQLLAGVAVGVSTYAIVLAVLWLGAGRPAGAEADLLRLVRRLLAKLLSGSWFAVGILAIALLAAPAQAATLAVGPGRPLDRPSAAARAARDGDTIAIAPGDYYDCAIWTRDHLTIAGTGPGVVITDTVCQDKALFIVRGNDTTIRNITFTRARVVDNNGAGIRAEGGDLTVESSRFIDNQTGLLVGGRSDSTVHIIDCEFTANGVRDIGPPSPALSVGAIATLRVEGSRFENSHGGADIFTGARLAELIGNRIEDGEVGMRDALVVLANGGSLVMNDNLLRRAPSVARANAAVHAYAGPTGTLQFRRNILINASGRQAALLLDWSQGTTDFAGNVLDRGDVERSTEGFWRHLAIVAARDLYDGAHRLAGAELRALQGISR